jgi:trans-aconitate methyltransferase
MTREGYITDIPYTEHYYGFLNPHWLRYIAAVNGLAAAPEETFTYCELGCGNGLSVLVHAAANPRAHFIGVDFNPDHIRNAHTLAQAGQVHNLLLLEEDFRALAARTDLPAAMDFICLHGIYSWVSPEVRAALRDFIGSRLKPGGLVFVSYNAMPGWAGLLPLRDMMRAYTANLPGSSLDKVQRGLHYLRWLKENGSAYFHNNPPAEQHLEQLLAQDARYLAHEYFNEHWHALYFHQVAEELGTVGLYYAGSTDLAQNYRDLCLPSQVQKAFDTVPNRQVFEIHKDFVANRRFRRDVFYKPGPARSQDPLAGLRFGLNVSRALVQFEIKVPVGTLRLEGERYPLLADALTIPRTLDELAREPTLSRHDRSALWASLQRLLLGGQVVPMPLVAGVPPPLNPVLLTHQLKNPLPVTLASPLLGAGLHLSFLDGLLLWACQQAEGEGALAAAHQWLARHGLQFQQEGGVLEGQALEDHLRAALARQESLQEGLAAFGVWPARGLPPAGEGGGKPA